MLRRMHVPSLDGLRPRSLSIIALSMSLMQVLSKGWMTIVCESGVEALAIVFKGVRVP